MKELYKRITDFLLYLFNRSEWNKKHKILLQKELEIWGDEIAFEVNENRRLMILSRIKKRENWNDKYYLVKDTRYFL